MDWLHAFEKSRKHCPAELYLFPEDKDEHVMQCECGIFE